MAIYHLHVKVLTRSKGHSAIKASAYRSGTKLKTLDGTTVDYSNRKDIITLPIYGNNLPDWATERQTLWESIERAEKRKDARLAREIEFALPIELSEREKLDCVETMSKVFWDSFHIPVDVVIHNKPDNPHVHMLIPTRELTPDGWGKKIRWMDNKEFVLGIRRIWQDVANKYLERYQKKIDHRSYKERGIDKVPQKHLGKKFWIEIKKAIKIGIDIVLNQFENENKKTDQTIKDPLQVPQQEPERLQRIQEKKRSRDRGRGIEL
ncbi:MAG: MobA/MobL family protein [Bacteroidota bacterium]